MTTFNLSSFVSLCKQTVAEEQTETEAMRSTAGRYLLILALPYWHGDGVVQDQSPDQTQNQLQVPIHNGFRV